MKRRLLPIASLSPLLLLLCAIQSCRGFSCPDNRQCYCFEELPGEHRVHCSANANNSAEAFDLQLQRHDRLAVECSSEPDWKDFMLGQPLEIGAVRSLLFVSCSPPGPRDAGRVASILGVDSVDLLRFVRMRNRTALSRSDLAAYPSMKKLLLSDNDLSQVESDRLFQDLDSLEFLELRNTQIPLARDMFATGPVGGQLKTLELGVNGYRRIDSGVFRGLGNLEMLVLWKNELERLDSGVFEGLENLRTLDLTMNKLTTLPADVFKDLVNVEKFNLGLNNFSSLPEGLFRHNPRVQSIKMLHNKQNLTDLPSRLFAGLAELRQIVVTRSGLHRLPEDLLWGCAALHNFTCDRNYLQTLPRQLFRDTAALESLSLSFNDIKELPDGLFEASSKLIRLDLSKNHLTSLTDKTLLGLESLEYLNLESNDLQHIHIDAFRSLVNLKVARFAHNRLTLRTGLYDVFGLLSPFHHCHSLEELHLAHNNVTEMHSDWLIGNTRLRLLDLKYNAFNYLQSEDLQFVSDELTVDLRHNNISRIVLTRLESIAGNQSQPRNVYVDIAANPLRCDCEIYELLRYLNGDMHPNVQNYVHLRPGNLSCAGPEYARGRLVGEQRARDLKCLVESPEARPGDPCSPDARLACACWLRPEDQALLLDCRSRGLRRAPDWIIDAADQRVQKVELDLSGNELTKAPSMHRKKGYEKVTSLNLAGNKISEIDETLLSPQLKTLRLEGNNLTRIDKSMLERLANSSQLTSLGIHDNPWSCSCLARDLLAFVQSNSGSNQLSVASATTTSRTSSSQQQQQHHQNRRARLVEPRQIRCRETDQALLDISISELCPALPNALLIVVCSAVSALALLLGCSLALFFKYQRQIKIWLFSKSLCMCLVSEAELDQDKIYDAFVSYSHSDEDFVVKELVAKLEEGPRPYKLCIHTRDWCAGEWISDQIYKSVEQSRRTLIVLSKSFVESDWGKLEFQAAHKQALAENRSRLIVILKGDIGPRDALDADLAAYLQTNTYIQWGDPWFWQKLRYAMPHNNAKDVESGSGGSSSSNSSTNGSTATTTIVAGNGTIGGGQGSIDTATVTTAATSTSDNDSSNGNDASPAVLHRLEQQPPPVQQQPAPMKKVPPPTLPKPDMTRITWIDEHHRTSPTSSQASTSIINGSVIGISTVNGLNNYHHHHHNHHNHNGQSAAAAAAAKLSFSPTFIAPHCTTV
ncbi:protein toll-like [Trichogramma pretiosum]|uniref:protein toll-like n=1 Tax=Trichogramma pretiosum TaxID=7493 RepID=UPI0006C9BFC1|nr:protein toll-like [Trichogramma pretiosum]